MRIGLKLGGALMFLGCSVVWFAPTFSSNRPFLLLGLLVFALGFVAVEMIAALGKKEKWSISHLLLPAFILLIAASKYWHLFWILILCLLALSLKTIVSQVRAGIRYMSRAYREMSQQRQD
jgi:hypothetical protein